MKLKMAPNSLFAVLLRKPWWMSFAVGAVLAVTAAALLPQDYRVVGALSTAPFFIIAAMSGWRRRGVPSSAQVERTTQAVSAMAWPQFAQLLEQTFSRDGYAVKRSTSGSGDFDFELERKGRTMLVAARRWKSARTGLEVLRALQQARERQEAPDALLICLGPLTDTARPFAAEHRIAIWQAAELAQALGKESGRLPPARA
jgi:restriction system protein